MKNEAPVKTAKALTGIRLTQEQVERITVLAAREKRVFSDMLRLLLDEALEGRKGKQ